MAASMPELPREWFAMDEISTEELARRQGVRPISTVADLAALAHPDAWESEEEFEDFLADLSASRRSDV